VTTGLLSALSVTIPSEDHLALSIVSSSATSSRVAVRFAVAGHLPKPLDIVAVLTDTSDHKSLILMALAQN
jgi:hypothetical protein